MPAPPVQSLMVASLQEGGAICLPPEIALWLKEALSINHSLENQQFFFAGKAIEKK